MRRLFDVLEMMKGVVVLYPTSLGKSRDTSWFPSKICHIPKADTSLSASMVVKRDPKYENQQGSFMPLK